MSDSSDKNPPHPDHFEPRRTGAAVLGWLIILAVILGTATFLRHCGGCGGQAMTVCGH